MRGRLNLDYVYTPSSRHSSSELDSVLDFRSSVDFYKVSLASLAMDFYVTQIAQKAQIFLASLCLRGAGAGWFLFSCSLRLRNLVNLVDFFPSGICPGAGSIKSRRFL